MEIVSQVSKDHPIDHPPNIPIDFNSIKQVPQSYIWVDQIDNIANNNNQAVESVVPNIPIIDLEDPDLDLLFDTCQTWGVFQITNYGVSNQVIKKVETQVMKLFSLPLEEKLKTLRTPGDAIGYGSPPSANYSSKLQWNEGFTLAGNPANHAMKLWPNDYQEFCDVMDDYQRRMRDLGDKLMSLLLKSLSIPESVAYWLTYHDSKDIVNLLQLNSYPTCPNPTQTVGKAPHTDSMFFTILHQIGNINGLQIFKDELGWVPVNLDMGALVVNVGDLLHILSNARFPSVLHRAVVDSEKHRISLAYFYGASLNFQVKPFLDYPNCEGAKYRSLEVKKYVGLKGKKRDLALSSIRI